MTLLERVQAAITDPPRTIVFPEGDDPTIQEAAVALARTGLVRPVLLGAPASVVGRLDGLVTDPAGCVVGPVREDPRLGRYAAAYARREDLPLGAAELIVGRPLVFAAFMVAGDDAHGMVAGIASPTADVIAASHLALGLRPGVTAPCTIYLLDIPGRTGPEGSLLAFADPATNPQPTSKDLAGLALAAGTAVRDMLGWEPRVALLSFSTHGSADHPAVDLVRDAVDLLRDGGAPFAVDGELQLDAALDERVATRKVGPGSAVAGRANVLVCPNLDAANIGAKLILHFTGATAYGPILLGTDGPVSDLSRGARLDDVVGSALLVAALPPRRRPSP